MLERSELEAIYKSYQAISDAGAWDRFASQFAQDGIYLEPLYGRIEGREAIDRWIVKVMKGLEDWSFPTLSVSYGDNCIVKHWLNRLPKQRPDGSWIEFHGVTVLYINEDGLIQEQVDAYNGLEAILAVLEMRTGRAGSLARSVLRGGWIRLRDGLRNLG